LSREYRALGVNEIQRIAQEAIREAIPRQQYTRATLDRAVNFALEVAKGKATFAHGNLLRQQR
jgi:hypothetical protein